MTRSTPPSGMPAALATTSTDAVRSEDPSRASRTEEIRAPRGEGTEAILAELQAMRLELSEVRAIRLELSEVRGELRQQLQSLSFIDDTTRNEVRRLERRTHDLEQAVDAKLGELRDYVRRLEGQLKELGDELREELRSDREQHHEDIERIDATVRAMRTYVEAAIKANTAAVDKVVAASAEAIASSREAVSASQEATGALLAAASRFDVALVHNESESTRLTSLEESTSAIVAELGVTVRHASETEPPPVDANGDEKSPPKTKLEKIETGAKRASWAAVALAVALALRDIVLFLRHFGE